MVLRVWRPSELVELVVVRDLRGVALAMISAGSSPCDERGAPQIRGAIGSRSRARCTGKGAVQDRTPGQPESRAWYSLRGRVRAASGRPASAAQRRRSDDWRILLPWQQSLEGRGIGLVTVEQLSWGGGLLQSRGLARVGATRQRVDLASSDCINALLLLLLPFS